MKKVVGFLIVAVFLSLPIYTSANVLGVAELKMSYSDPSGVVTFPEIGTGNFYFDYDAELTWKGSTHRVEIFCVEDIPGTTGNEAYTLLSIDSTLSTFGLDPDRYLSAAWIADKYYNYSDNPYYISSNSQDYWKAAAQIAIWEVIFDYQNLELAGGNFTSDNDYNERAQIILNDLSAADHIGATDWALAVNPLVDNAGNVARDGYQNYLVKTPAPVPEPATLILLGTGLIGLAGFGRKKFKNGSCCPS